MSPVSNKLILWAVDLQADFMLPAGKLYVQGAERLLPNVKRLIGAARQGHVFVVSHGCFHAPDDPEFKAFPPHCVKGTAGAEYIPEALTEKVALIANNPGSALPADLSQFHQILLEKQTLDIFQSVHAEELLRHLPASAAFIVFGVTTEYCVRLAAEGLLRRGKRVFIVEDAVEALKREDGERAKTELSILGGTLISTHQALALLRSSA